MDPLEERSTARPAGRNPSGERTLAEQYDAVLLDLDGVLYRGDAPIEGAAATLSRLRELAIPRLFLTNNSSRTPGEVARSLRTLGIDAEPGEVLTSGAATAALLRRQGLAGATAFVIGEAGVREPLEEAGVRLVDGGDGTADLVVVGLDRSVDYAKLRTAALLVQRGARLVATNSDASYPAPDGLWPGAGAILAAVTTATGAVPEVVGKPERPLFRAAAEATGARSPLVVGDRLETDVAGAEGMGWDSLLVMSGASTLADLIGLPHEPTYIGRDVSSLLDDRPPARFRQARVSDVLALRDLLEASSLGAAGVEDRLAQTLVAPKRSPGAGLAAAACLLDVGDGLGLLRSVAVDPLVRGSGLGTLAVAAALRKARLSGLSVVHLFTEGAEPFFERLGFARTDRERLPPSVAGNPQALEECAANAVPMTLRL